MSREMILQSGAKPESRSGAENAAKTTSGADTSRFFATLTAAAFSPRRFFAELENTEKNFRNSLRFLAYAALFNTMLSVTYFFDHKLAMAGILFINAMVLPGILAGLALLVMNMFMGRRIGFKRVFSIYAFASGVVLPVSWIPALQIFTEPLRALLVGVGLVKACGLRWWQAALALIVSVGLFLMLFWSALPVIMQLKQALFGA